MAALTLVLSGPGMAQETVSPLPAVADTSKADTVNKESAEGSQVASKETLAPQNVDPYLAKSSISTTTQRFPACPSPRFACNGIYEGQCCHWPGTPSCACIDNGTFAGCVKHFCIIGT